VLDDLQGRWIAVSGLDGNKNPISEVVRVTNVSGSVLSVNPGLESTYAIDTVAINANIAQATHGETVQEVLGSGAAGITFQRFNLKQPPLTYVSAANASGVDSTLEIRVNDVLWHEVPTLYGRGPRDRVYISRQDDAGNTTAEFGDSITGARLPSGQMNVRARYRRGIGLGGLLSKGQLSMLLSRPHGLRGVTNPDDTRGAQDPERLDEARLNAPLTVMTLDRAVSLDDYEDFSRAFAGAAKAMASWMWLGTSRQIFITVSGPLGNPIPSGSEVSNNLLSALRKAGDPFLSIHVGSYRPVQFQIDATVKIDPDFESDKVLAEVKQKLLNAFSFDVRSFGEPVFLSEVISLVQLVPGVVALDVNTLYRAGATPSLEQRLLAEMPTVSAAGEVLPAELLTLDSAKRINLGVMS
jgi:predicted phage baseplate assembly protein